MHSSIEQFITEFNNSWINGNFVRLNHLLHDDVVFVPPGHPEVLGKSNCIKSLVDFVSVSKTNKFVVTETSIHVFGSTVMVKISYEIDFEINGRNYSEQGTEYWTLRLESGLWKMVWRYLVPK